VLKINVRDDFLFDQFEYALLVTNLDTIISLGGIQYILADPLNQQSGASCAKVTVENVNAPNDKATANSLFFKIFIILPNM
jgi:hypothetical protein